MTIKYALISVSDKTGIIDLAKKLIQYDITILSTGGTAKLLFGAGISVIEVSDYTGFPEMLDGRVKTLHPKIHAGILARNDLSDHQDALNKASIPNIELVIVNLYPFRQTIAKQNCSLDDAIENIDIGGPTMVRAAAKNYQKATVVTDPHDYSLVCEELAANSGSISLATRFMLAKKAFTHTAAYDSAISNYLTALDTDYRHKDFPDSLNLNFNIAQHLRYGENPHQKAAFYRDESMTPGSLANYQQLQGKELSYNNIADTDAAWECVKTFDRPACVIVKHANPCGIAIAETTLRAYQLAFATDPISAFGGIIAFNRIIDTDTAEAVLKQFVEVIIAPEITQEAQQLLLQKNNIRVLTLPLQIGHHRYDLKRVGGGILVQTPDILNITGADLKIVTKVIPTPQQFEDLLFAWRVAKFVKSNAIVFCRNGQTAGIGAGQMSRVDSARIASIKAQQAGLTLAESVVASDAFFPFRDGLDVVVQAGATAIIQPGGSIRDNEVIAAADEQGVSMVFTGIRHFRH
ncbi:MAG: bifunctional phosphoribosylaminoimidazolecarboxamide formyltransferase/IMP cyclohydrolase [Nitrosomonas sp.]|uniref:bifunctional phosphoribosylaminoimidazolecarboxamide formyltransferase/IMP cyclohydrolase n=2 Tax=Nitrosomonas sp. TaxID=42353 RepID=UPI002728EB9A|nr:bifunctional phosphoribosylaminoimidazolecarboxamide formyltransferase/IMP cyclohydrolase [Nitrosomonas sp.]MDO8893984.1 bifunctional phosphoribosylaminoimidazolecarboxamide formyltransferase/IMP cyclohydrolase [Nitrosomonas sp.]MDP1935010.1 bifunctional phosphoribosylaminoimidazolecarboxamide formyltransferase/IMP cyclohydrolase [Nitrosomonas sp.]MDP3665001.1 bifunctional phosphoribosylaminoimidazolecarboxamide formyltransferase/IMP cyclohydrolase [Nitrosomonas sp.]MDZ4107318.1 bifunctional